MDPSRAKALIAAANALVIACPDGPKRLSTMSDDEKDWLAGAKARAGTIGPGKKALKVVAAFELLEAALKQCGVEAQAVEAPRARAPKAPAGAGLQVVPFVASRPPAPRGVPSIVGSSSLSQAV